MKLLYFDIIDVSEEIDVNKRSASKECDTCHSLLVLFKQRVYVSTICMQ